MNSKLSYSELNGFGTAELTPLRVQFWYFEYLKRNLLLNERRLCEQIKIASINVGCEIVEKEILPEGCDVISLAIDEMTYKEFGLGEDKTVYFKGNILDKIVKSKINFNFLYSVTKRYSYYAHKLIDPHDMSLILKYIDNGKDVADIESYNLPIFIDPSQFQVEIHPQASSLDIGNSKLTLSIDIADKCFNIESIVDEIVYRLASRRSLLKKLGATVTLSSKEHQALARKNLPAGQDPLSHATDKNRAIGLWCWDKVTGLSNESYAMYVQGDPNIKLPFLVPFAGKEKMKITNRELLFELIESQLLINFPASKKLVAPCEHEKESCLYDESGKKGGTKLNRKCSHYQSCLRNLAKHINIANESIEKRKVISIG